MTRPTSEILVAGTGHPNWQDDDRRSPYLDVMAAAKKASILIVSNLQVCASTSLIPQHTATLSELSPGDAAYFPLRICLNIPCVRSGADALSAILSIDILSYQSSCTSGQG